MEVKTDFLHWSFIHEIMGKKKEKLVFAGILELTQLNRGYLGSGGCPLLMTDVQQDFLHCRNDASWLVVQHVVI